MMITDGSVTYTRLRDYAALPAAGAYTAPSQWATIPVGTERVAIAVRYRAGTSGGAWAVQLDWRVPGLTGTAVRQLFHQVGSTAVSAAGSAIPGPVHADTDEHWEGFWLDAVWPGADAVRVSIAESGETGTAGSAAVYLQALVGAD